MRFSTFLVGCAALIGATTAQSNFTSCCNIEPNSVDGPTRASWCRAQTNTCPEVCNGQTKENTCDSTKLTFTCTCLTGNTPNISDYAQTLPSLECDNWVAQCTAAHPNDLAGQTFCQSFLCGRKNATAGIKGPSGTSSASASGSSATGSSSGTSSPSASASAKSAAAVMRVGKEWGVVGVCVLLGGLFGVAL
ncbi:hypothetical protein EJ06DRAFT_502645 [Trichodelitschia bisporula]|uniref:DUF7707 domain-containing protein n=1 Tax=Trichodelitschia bisporula TaxID=703511 RepID=A0A6G1IAY2_9PEZI|nr:hypothetical protein EJ06DRAFT_502645 [Trichodelitschia bisporula]